MNKHSLYFACLLFLLGAWQSVQAAHVAITMNSVTNSMTLQDESGTTITEDSQTGNTYVFNSLPNGSYTIYGYNSNSEMNGTFTFDVDDDDIEMQIWTITKISTSNKKEDNSYWVYGEDFTIEDCEVHSREGKTFPVTIGTNANNPSVLTYDGGSVVLRMVPSAAHQEEGYIFANDGRTVTGNTTIQTKIPMGGLFTSTCPADAEIAMMQKPGGDLGTGTIHYVPFRFIAPESVKTTGDTKTYTWYLGNACKYNMRAWKEGGLTQLLTFYFNTNPAKCPVLNFTEADFAARDPKWVDHDPQSLDGLNDCNILLNINEKGYLKMTAGQEYDLMAERDWQIAPNQTDNYFLEPDYHYAVYDMNGNPDNSVVEIVPDGNIGSEWSILRAKSAGTAIVTVTYDAASAVQYANNGKMSPYYGGQYFGAIWPENTGVFVVSVDAPENGMDANMRINETYNEDQKKNAGIYVDAEHDVFYYINDEETFNYTFKPTGVQTVEISYPTIRMNDAVYNTGWHVVSKNEDNTYTLPLKHGRQIVRLGDGTGKYEYQVLTARHATRTIINETRSGSEFYPGDQVRVQYNGLFHPANKLSGIYNMSAYITYNGVPEGTAAILGPNQYWFGASPAAQAYTKLIIPVDYTESTYSLRDGVIQVFGFGDPIGNHRIIDKVGGRSPNFTAVAHTTYFGALPDVIIPVKQPVKTLATLELDPADAEIISVTNSLGIEVTPEDGKYLLTQGENIILAGKTGYKRTPITVTIEENSPAEMTVPVHLEAIPVEGWDGETLPEPAMTGGIYHITSGAELAWFAAQVNACEKGNVTAQTIKGVLDNDIDLCSYNWTPIGKDNSYKKFAGSFDGQGHTVDNLCINTTDGSIFGLFGSLAQGAEIMNFTVRGSVTTTSNSTSLKAGGVAGQATGSSANPVRITNVTNYVNVTGIGVGKYAAGICGYAGTYVYIDRCANYGNVTLSNETSTKATDAAGIAFINSNNCSITNSYNCGTIVANNNVGGIYATSQNITVTNVYNTGRVHATRTNNSGYSCHGAIRPTANTTTETENVTNAYANEDFLFNELNTTIITAPEAWTGGEVAYKLGDAFGQEIGVDPLPVLGGMQVYENTLPDDSKIYSNASETYGEYLRENLVAGQMGTVCIPYASFRTFDDTFYKILYKEVDGEGMPLNITLEEVTQLEPGVPYVFVPKTDILRIWYAESTQVLTAGNENGLHGTFEYITDGAAGTSGNKLEGNYVIYNNMFQRCGGNCRLPENRAYIKMNEVPVQGSNNAPKPIAGRRHVVIGNAQAPQVTTGLNEQMVNDKMNQCYDILGRPVNSHCLEHGVYIINGQKIVK